MNWQALGMVITGLLAALFFIIALHYERKNRKFKRLLSKPPASKIEVPGDLNESFKGILEDTNPIERLYLLRSMIGSSYEARILVSSAGIHIIEVGVLALHDRESKREEITG